MAVIVTGAAGFIGYHVSKALLARGDEVVGIDNINAYYSVALKIARLKMLEGEQGFTFYKMNIDEHAAVTALFARTPHIRSIIHLAAQAGVRYSLENPFAYIASNITGQVSILEAARHLPALQHFVYASSSSVYGGNTKLPFSVEDRVDEPISLYAATKRADELITHAYCDLYKIAATGLRFFTVYGPWGRPDMAAYLFTEAIVSGRPIKVFNNGDMERDFTFVDDIVSGVIAALDRKPQANGRGTRHAIYNLGNHRPEPLLEMISLLEQALGREAIMEFAPLQAGDVRASCADIESSRRDLGFEPQTKLAQGIPRFVEWYRAYEKNAAGRP
jgi:UDP-glucuronate 4-epimerase